MWHRNELVEVYSVASDYEAMWADEGPCAAVGLRQRPCCSRADWVCTMIAMRFWRHSTCGGRPTT